jgi:hypothetical protein
VVTELGEIDRHLFVCRPGRGNERSLVLWAGVKPSWVDPDEAGELVLVALWTFAMPVREAAAFVAGRLERLYHSEERRRGCKVAVVWEAGAWPDARHAGDFAAALPYGLDPGTVVRVEPGDRLPGWEPGRSLAVGRDVLLSRLGRAMKGLLSVALPAEGKALDSGVLVVGRDELRDALARVQARPPRQPGPDAPPEEGKLLLEDHVAAAVGLALWAAEQGLGSFWVPRDPLEAHAQERGDVYRRAYHHSRTDEDEGPGRYASRLSYTG